MNFTAQAGFLLNDPRRTRIHVMNGFVLPTFSVTSYNLYRCIIHQREEEFRYLGTTLTNQNSVQEEIKNRLNACYHSVQNLLSSSLPSKNLKNKIFRTIILSVVLYGCETWSLTLREEQRLRVFENRVLRRLFGPRRDGVTGEWRKLHKDELNSQYS